MATCELQRVLKAVKCMRWAQYKQWGNQRGTNTLTSWSTFVPLQEGVIKRKIRVPSRRSTTFLDEFRRLMFNPSSSSIIYWVLRADLQILGYGYEKTEIQGTSCSASWQYPTTVSLWHSHHNHRKEKKNNLVPGFSSIYLFVTISIVHYTLQEEGTVTVPKKRKKNLNQV